ncbi:hypothetical protein BHE74_00009705, partial [Ensete ventricosum]
ERSETIRCRLGYLLVRSPSPCVGIFSPRSELRGGYAGPPRSGAGFGRIPRPSGGFDGFLEVRLVLAMRISR